MAAVVGTPHVARSPTLRRASAAPRVVRPKAPRRQLAAAAAPPPYSALIVWDVDNVRPPRGVPLGALLGALAAAVEGAAVPRPASTPAPRPPFLLTAFANDATLGTLPGFGADLAAAAGCGGIVEARLQSVPVLRGAADVAAISAAAAFLLRTPPPATLAVVSGDAGFARLLAYAASRPGVASLVVTPFRQRQARPDAWRKDRLVVAAGGAVLWGDVVQEARTQAEREGRGA